MREDQQSGLIIESVDLRVRHNEFNERSQFLVCFVRIQKTQMIECHNTDSVIMSYG